MLLTSVSSVNFTAHPLSAVKNTATKSAANLDRDFDRFTKHLDHYNETEADRAGRKEQETKAFQHRREQSRKANALKGRIAQLQSKLLACREEAGVKAELAMAKTQLYWLSNSL